MSTRPEHWILCGGASHAEAPADALRLAASGDSKNLTVDIQGITKALTGQVPPEFRDLILIAAYVFAADQAFSRGASDDTDMGDKWRRSFRFVIGVERPDLWSSPEMQRLLESTLSFLSDDYYAFEFVKGTDRPSEQLCLSTPKGEPLISWDHISEIVLFSGGLDSLGGVADQFMRQEHNVIAVSHRSADKTYSTQRWLLEEMRKLAPKRSLPHVGIRVHRHEARLRTERTQRSRSFLYAAIAGTVARLVGLRHISFYENGPIALNLPISRQLVGARGTRTAHPKVLRGFADILSRVSGETFEVRNPFELKSRAEVIQHIVACGAGDLMKKSVSCAYVTKKGRSQIQYPHCGVCSQCVDRQFSFRAAGHQSLDSDEGYEVHLVRDEWTTEHARAMLLDYVDAASRFSRCTSKEEFLSLFGEATRAVQGLYEGMSQDAERIAQAVFELHKRHGDGVMRVVSDLFAQSSASLLRGDVAPHSAVALLSKAGLERCGVKVGNPTPDPDPPPVAPWTGSEYMFRKQGDMWLVRYRGGEIYPVTDNKGMVHIHTLLQRPGDYISTDTLTSISEGQDIARDSLQISLDATDEAVASVRKSLRKLEEEIEEAKEFSHDDEVARLELQQEQLVTWLAQETRRGGKAGRELKAVKQSRDRAWKNIDRAIDGIKKHSQPLAAHLGEELERGHLARYRQTGIAWEL